MKLGIARERLDGERRVAIELGVAGVAHAARGLEQLARRVVFGEDAVELALGFAVFF